MTQDEIIEMAQECRLIGMRPHLDGIYSEALVAFAKLVADKALAEHAMREVQRLGQEIEQEPLEYWNAVEGWVKIDEVREHFETVGCATIYKTAGEGRVPLSLAKAQPEQEIEPDDIASILACQNMFDAQPVPEVDRVIWPEHTEQESVAWMDADGNVSDNNDHKCFPIPLYTQPPQRKPLTHEQRKDLMNKAWDKWLGGEDDNHLFAWHFSFEVEAAHGIKENT